MFERVTSFDVSQWSVEERIELAHKLLDSVDETGAHPLTAEQREELQSRIAAVDAGEMELIPWENVKKMLFDRE